MSERVLVCGSRTWTDGDTIARVIAQLPEDAVIIHGAARGADSMAEHYAICRGLFVYPCPADWRKYGRAAGPIRNQQMLDEHHPDRVIAFRMPGESKGTDDMIRRAKAAGIPVTVWSPEVKL